VCSIDYDRPSVYRTAELRARREHNCDECGRKIASGETYRRAFGVWDGHPGTFKTCAHCCVGQDWLLQNCNGFMHAALADEMAEHADEYRAVRFTMNRIRLGMRRKWRRFDCAGLMPLQPMPPKLTEHALVSQAEYHAGICS
jgi:ribosomal protein L37AE/L43A